MLSNIGDMKEQIVVRILTKEAIDDSSLELIESEDPVGVFKKRCEVGS